jgi:hypothetical protein
MADIKRLDFDLPSLPSIGHFFEVFLPIPLGPLEYRMIKNRSKYKEDDY